MFGHIKTNFSQQLGKQTGNLNFPKPIQLKVLPLARLPPITNLSEQPGSNFNSGLQNKTNLQSNLILFPDSWFYLSSCLLITGTDAILSSPGSDQIKQHLLPEGKSLLDGSQEKKSPGLSRGENHSVSIAKLKKKKALRTAFSRQEGDVVKHLIESGCTVVLGWWQFHSEDHIQQCGAWPSFLSFSFEWPQGGQEDKDDRIILAALWKELVTSPDTVTIKVPGWLLMGITSRKLSLKTTVLRSVFCSYKQIVCSYTAAPQSSVVLN